MKLLTLLACCMGLITATAAENEPATDGEKALATLFGRFEWTKGPARAKIGSHAVIQIPAGYMFTGAKGAQGILQAFGNPTSGNELAYLAPTSMTWSVVFEFDEIGYVKDDEKDKLDADAMLKSIQAGTEASNQERKRMGAGALHVTGWQQAPSYNPETHNLEWAIGLESEGEPGVNFNTRLLGRKGVMSATLLVDPERLKEVLPTYQALLKEYAFNEGDRYAEYRQGDKLAKYGLAALITGGAAAVAVKTGLFGAIVLFFKKAWKLVVIGLVAVGAFVKKVLFGASERKPSE